MNTNRWLTLALAALLAGCAVGPDYEAPRPVVSGSWSALGGKSPEQTSVATARSADLARWWGSFNDPALDALIDRALVSSLDLKVAAARVREARALRGVAQGALLPEVGGSASYDRARGSENGPLPSSGKAFNLYQAGFDASWEIDVFGGTRRTVEAAAAEEEAAIENLRDVRVVLLAEVARNYAELRGFQSQLAIAGQNVDGQQKTLELTRTRRDAGRATDFDVARAEAQVSTTSSAIPTLESAIRLSIHRLGLLLGQEPEALAAELSETKPLPKAPAEIPVGLPTELLRRRPDLRRSERELAAATARIGVATADLYPRFFLTGAFGLQSVGASDFATASSRLWSAGPQIQWALFQGGRIRANIEVQNSRQEQAAIRFEQSLLGALKDVEDALVQHAKEQVRRRTLAQAVASQQRAADLADQRYAQGLVDFLNVLDAQRQLYIAQDALVQSDRAIITHSIALYKAVGGGWPAEIQ
jgi:NodT family efflux transporter outer membrane factor (OMF) lipoprotein